MTTKKYVYKDCREFTQQVAEIMKPNSVWRTVAMEALMQGTEPELVQMIKGMMQEAPEETKALIGENLSEELCMIRYWREDEPQFWSRFNNDLYRRFLEVRNF